MRHSLEAKSKQLAGDHFYCSLMKQGTRAKNSLLVKTKSQQQQASTGANSVDEAGYKVFLSEPEDVPKLSILQNYKKINRILTSTYVRSFDPEKRYLSKDEDWPADSEQGKWVEQHTNSQRMQTVLKSLHAPCSKRRRREEQYAASEICCLGSRSRTAQGGHRLKTLVS